jgi:hypothetical protein
MNCAALRWGLGWRWRTLGLALPAVTERGGRRWVQVGSHALGTSALPDLLVDLAVEIPRACLHEKDQLNYRWAGCDLLGCVVGFGVWSCVAAMRA